MRTAATRPMKDNTFRPVLHMALELDTKSWKLAFGTGLGHRPRERQVGPGDTVALQREVEQAKARFGLDAEATVVSCYEAGRDGFWLHRWLVKQGIENAVVDAASIEVSRRMRRSKTDRLDVRKLLEKLIKFESGSREWRVVRVPNVEEEDARHLHRELETIKADRTAVVNRIKGLLATHGLRLKVNASFPHALQQARLWDDSPVPAGARARLVREWQAWLALEQRLDEVEAARRLERKNGAAQDPAVQKVLKLEQLRSIGIESSTLLVREVFGWRDLKNRRQVGAIAGLTPTPYSSGATRRELGISKAGNPRVRRCAIELAWMWVRYQPQSALTRWFEQRYAHGGPSQRKIGITALARKLLIALWRYLELDQLPEGAVLKA